MSMRSAANARTTATWTQWALRVTATLLTVLFVLQGLTGGEYLVGNEAVLDLLHSPGATAIHIVSGLQMVIAGVLWFVGGGPVWPTVLSALVFGVSFLQASLGHGNTLDYHVPLAMVLLVAVTWVLVWSWRTPTSQS